MKTNVAPSRSAHNRGESGEAASLPSGLWLERRAIEQAKGGDPEGVHFLYAFYADDIVRFIRSLVHDHHEAEDITHSVFAKLQVAIGKYEEREASFAAWLFRVARNAALDHLRTRRQIPVAEVRPNSEGDPFADSERSQSLRHALGCLPDDQREVLVLRHVNGLSPAEIASKTGRSESSVHGLHHRGRIALKASLVELETVPVTAGRSTYA